MSCQGFGCTGEVCANSRGEKGQCTVPKRLEKYGWWKCQLSNTHISPKNSHLLSVTFNLIRRFTKRQVPRGGVYGGLVILAHPRLFGYPCASSTHGTWGYSIYYTPSKG